MVPTYFRRCSGIECFNGHRGFALLFFEHDTSVVVPGSPGTHVRPENATECQTAG